MRTPDGITLIEKVRSVYDPDKDEYQYVGNYFPEEESYVSCMATFMSYKKVFETYGWREEKVLVVRFNHEVQPFEAAVFYDEIYEPIEKLTMPITPKASVHLKRVG